MKEYSTLLTSLEEGILTITINRPDKMNALNKEVITDLGLVMDEVTNNDAIKAVIITGAGGRAFVAGADISEFEGLSDKEGAELALRGAQLVFNKIENTQKPVIAAVNGFALGGGCELAMACHFRIASSNAQFGQPEVNLGLIPGYGGTQRLVQLIGKGRAMELLMSANMIKADQALEWGLVNHVYESDQLLEETKKILNNILTKAPIAISHIISLVNEAATVSKEGFKQEIEKFGACFATEDKLEGTQAFMEKRKAIFKGK